MNNRLASLRQFAKRHSKDKEETPQSAWEWIKRAHAHPLTRGMLPLEAVPLWPYWHEAETKTQLGVLFGIPLHDQTEASAPDIPQAASYKPTHLVVWSYPELSYTGGFALTDLCPDEKLPSFDAAAVATQSICGQLEDTFTHGTTAEYTDSSLPKLYRQIFEQVHAADRVKAAAPKTSSELPELMARVQALLQELKQDDLLAMYRKIHYKLYNSGFTIVLVGEFSRGKSTLINLMLQGQWLPVGDLPTTAMLTKIVYGPEPFIEHIKQDGSKKRYPLAAEFWEALTIDHSGSGPEGVVRVELPDKWLEQTGVHLIDTPGAGDLNDDRSKLVNEAIIGCDGAIIAVSAIMALSLTEKSFIEQHLVTKKVPHIMLAVTRLDQVEPQHRERVAEYVKEKVASWGLDIPVFIPQPADGLHLPQWTGNTGIDRMKAQVETWLADDRHTELRTKHISAHMEELLLMAIGFLQARQQALKLSDDQRQQARKEQELAMQKLGLRWEEYRLEMLRRAGRCLDWIRDNLDDKKQPIIERLQFELSRTSNPKAWWSEELPYRLKSEMSQLARGVEEKLGHMFAQDLKWLSDVIANDYQAVLPAGGRPSDRADLDFGNPSLPGDPVSDAKRVRLFMRLGTGAATVLGYVLFGPFGMIASIGGGILSEIWLNKSVDKQKELLKQMLPRTVEETCVKVLDETSSRIYSLYDKAISQSEAQEALWLRKQQEALRMSGTPDRERYKLLDDQISRASQLKQAFTAILEGAAP